MSKLTFGAADRRSPLWLKVSEHLKGRLDTLRRQNDAPSDVVTTALLRGRIAELKLIIALGEEPKVKPEE